MKAAVYEQFGQPLRIQNVPDPAPQADGVVIRVAATGICRSDWHGWMGHDPDITLPHVPGHELAGIVAAVGRRVTGCKPGDRVTLPFVNGCGACPQCLSGNHQVCDHQFQPGFTHWGSFAEYVAVDYADTNLVHLPEAIGFATAATLGCRFITAFRAVVDQAKVNAGQWVAVHGCGGVGLSVIMIARALGASTVGIDISADKLDLAASLGADAVIDATEVDDIPSAVKDTTGGGAHVSIDALGSPVTCFNSIASLRKRGKHVQIGLMLADHRHPRIPMDQVIANELELLGSHGMQAHRYDGLLQMIASGKLDPGRLIGRRVDLETGISEMTAMDSFKAMGVTVIDTF